MTNRAGLEFPDPGFQRAGRFALEALFRLPLPIRESLLFSSSAVCLPFQKLLQRLLGGAFVIQARFTEGPLSTYYFECRSPEKYFMLGSGIEPEVQQLVTELVQPGDTIFDIGAHVGCMALLFSTLCGQKGHVFAFEPSPSNFLRLKHNLDLNPVVRITPVQVAASDKECTSRFLENGSMSSIVREEAKELDGATYTDIRSIRLDDFVYRDRNPPPNLVKIDIEGYAGPCMRGMRRILRECRPSIVLEVHHKAESGEVMRFLQEYRYHSETIGARNEFPRHLIATPR